ncbi:carbonic anhydrase [Streptomyces sp. CG 926]|uniref:carbonic anhydrase n=1 Tax=Streptomyces sp. CG 926 TaxID=1882405 RepID=UPI000D6DA8EF|nr:carbonic anhydrase [Streptomyces sp. CG 926]PWK65098.1 carbonic anhydrase [Streptomyces sp. CG 926]
MSGPDGLPVDSLVEGTRTYRARAAALRVPLTDPADGQRPKAMLIACSDARLLPSLITGSGPGEVLELRTHGGLVPRFDPEQHTGEALTIEYAVATLRITDIVVLGHSLCEVVDVSAGHTRQGEALTGDFTAAGHRHVLKQMDVLSDYPCVAPRLADGSLRLHGWYHDLGTGSTVSFRPHLNSFRPL